MSGTLVNRVAVVTGSSRGIGAAIAARFAKEGAAVVVNYIRDGGAATRVARSIEAGGGTVICCQADVSTTEGAQLLFDTAVSTFGSVSVLVNNAAVMSPKAFFDLAATDVSETLATNVVGPLLCSQIAGRLMCERGRGTIVNIASISGLPSFGTPSNLAYAISKAALVSLTGVLAKALAPHVNVNCIAPGQVHGGGMPPSPEYERRLGDRYLARPVSVHDVADSCVFLGSDAARSITGATVVIDAGFGLR